MIGVASPASSKEKNSAAADPAFEGNSQRALPNSDTQSDAGPPASSPGAAEPVAFSAGKAAPRASTRRIARPTRDRLNLYLLRHASAGTSRANPKLDLKRPLDKEGKQHCFHLAYVLNGLNVNFDLIVSSPLKRCLQTAQLIGTETGYEAKILHSEALAPHAEFSQFQRLLHECRSYENVLMVGHNPTLTTFLGLLIAGSAVEAEPGHMARLRVRKGSIARLTLDRGPATMQWMLDPRIVRALYATSTKSSRRRTSRK